MISLDSVERSILELEQRDTSLVNCERLAWLYIVRDHIKGYVIPPSDKSENKAITGGNSEFLKEVNGRNTGEVWAVMDEVMQTIKGIHPKMYSHVMDKIRSI